MSSLSSRLFLGELITTTSLDVERRQIYYVVWSMISPEALLGFRADVGHLADGFSRKRAVTFPLSVTSP